MIRINNIPAPLGYTEAWLRDYISARLGIAAESVKSVKLNKKSVDARNRGNIFFILSVNAEIADGGIPRGETPDEAISESEAMPSERAAAFIPGRVKPAKRPMIVGSGPCGLFAALILAEAGAEPVVLERGADADSRAAAVERFWRDGTLDPENNVQFGEGGAGTFSDGKLSTGIRDARIAKIMKTFVECGAPERILTDAKPHVGTDLLRGVIKNLRGRIISTGGEFRFGARFADFTADSGGKIASVMYVSGGREIWTDAECLIIAAGHSARDVFELLREKGVGMSRKSFAVGLRIEHPRAEIDRSLYGDFAGHPELGAAEYKLSCRAGGRGVYTFCMCPGGAVVAAASEPGRLAVNGMSLNARDGANSNSALLVGVDPADYPGDGPLAGVELQRSVERRAFLAGGGNYRAPVILAGDFLRGRESSALGEVMPSLRPGFSFAPPEAYLPDYICAALRAAIAEFAKKIRGFDRPDAVLTGAESRSSSPVRIERGEDMQSPAYRGLYPCGEGAGWAGGIVSAAVDGIRCAERIVSAYGMPEVQ